MTLEKVSGRLLEICHFHSFATLFHWKTVNFGLFWRKNELFWPRQTLLNVKKHICHGSETLGVLKNMEKSRIHTKKVIFLGIFWPKILFEKINIFVFVFFKDSDLDLFFLQKKHFLWSLLTFFWTFWPVWPWKNNYFVKNNNFFFEKKFKIVIFHP